MAVPQLSASDLADPASLNSRLTYLENLVGGGSSQAGTTIFYAGSTLPSGWLECDGSAVSRATYSALFALIGTSFGVGDGTTTFNLPDLRGRTPIGIGTGSGLSTRTVGQQLGEETHQLTIPELPAHTHPTGNIVTGNGLLTAVAGQFAPSGVNNANSVSAGSDSPHNNMQPSIALKAIIKT